MNSLMRCTAAAGLLLAFNIMPAHGQAERSAPVEAGPAQAQMDRSRVQLEWALRSDPRLQRQLSTAAEARDLRRVRALLAQAGIHAAPDQGGPADSVYCDALGEMTTEFDCMIITVLCATC